MFSGDTNLCLPTGGEVSFLELYEKQHPVTVGSFDFQKQEIVDTKGYDVRCTKKVTELVEVELETGEKVHCTRIIGSLPNLPDMWKPAI